MRLFVETSQNHYFSELFERHCNFILARCRGMLQNRSAAEEVAQDAFVRAFERARLFRGGSVKAWLLTIAKHLCINRLRRSHVEGEALGGLRRGSPETITGEREILAQVAAVLNLLNSRQRTCLKMFYFNAYSYAEIVAITGWDMNAVRSAIQNGRLNFTKLWNDPPGGRP